MRFPSCRKGKLLHKDANAAAVAAYYHPDENTLLSLGTTLGNGSPMVSAGLTVNFGPGGNTHTMSRTALTQKLSAVTQENQMLNQKVDSMAQVIVALQKQVAELAAANAAKK